MNDASTNDIVDPQSGEVIPAVLSFEQAFQTYKNFVKDNRDRTQKNAAIARKLNNEQPWNPQKLKAAGQSWRSNRPTGFMSSLIKRLTPPYKQMVDQLPLLSYSRFPNEAIGSDVERDVFRASITDCIRQWPGWADFVTQLIDEDIGYGYAAVGREDEFSWKPKMYRSDEAMFYVGCPQQASKVKIWGLKEDFFVDDIVSLLKNPEASQDAGWRIENLIKKLNTSGKQFDDRSAENNTRVYEDLIRENNLAASFSSAIRVIKAGHVFALNPAGGIDHYIFDRDDGTALFFRAGRYAKMEHCLTLFSAEVGDRTLHGSRGAGRALYNTHVSVEQARNLVQDALHLSGLLLLKRTHKTGSGSLETPGLTVSHPFAIVGEGFEVLDRVKFEVNSEAFFALDRHATSQAEIQIGAFMPGQIINEKGERRTASEVNYVASIDAQIRAGVLARFADQMFSLIDQLQRRICSPEIVAFAEQTAIESRVSGSLPIYEDDVWEALVNASQETGFMRVQVPKYLEVDAVQCVVEMMLKGVTAQQILVLANTNSRANVDDAIASQSGVLDMIVARYGQDPIVDTTELKRRDIAAKLGGQAAERLLNVDLNPLSQLKQQRQQIIELSTMLASNDVPVDPTDDDRVHLSVIIDRIRPMLSDPTISPLTSSQQFLVRVLNHAGSHLQAALNKGISPAELSEAKKILGILQKFVQIPPIDQQASQALQPVTQGGALPATEVGKDALQTPQTPLTDPQNIVANVANPARPTPPKGTNQPGPGSQIPAS